MTLGDIVDTISLVSKQYYPVLIDYAQKIAQKADKEREDELDRAIQEVEADMKAGRYTSTLEEHFARLDCV